MCADFSSDDVGELFSCMPAKTSGTTLLSTCSTAMRPVVAAGLSVAQAEAVRVACGFDNSCASFCVGTVVLLTCSAADSGCIIDVNIVLMTSSEMHFLKVRETC